MRILLWHGYLLRGSGSNVYTANIARAWRELGHDVLLLCQERREPRPSFVDAFGIFDEANENIGMAATGAVPAAGTCSVACPDIGSILPVYVLDPYEGFEAKLFTDLTEGELRDYTDRNVAAMTTAIRSFMPDAIVTGHEVMGPSIARRACEETGTSYAVKLHGSALEFAVKRQERYLREAAFGLVGARAIAGGSAYMIEEASSVVPGWEDRAAVVNPGCDVDLFRPGDARKPPPPIVGFVGRLITNKGVHDLLAAIALTQIRPLRLVIAGDGSFRGALETMASALKAGDVRAAHAALSAGDLEHIASARAFLDDPGLDLRSAMHEVNVSFLGHLDHEPLARVLPSFDVLVVPSIVPEAFGMVAAEAAASGVLPIVPSHSGISEAGAQVEEAIDRPGFLTFDHRDVVASIARRVDAVLALDVEERARLGERAADLARRRWSWERVAQSLLALAVPDRDQG